METIQRPVVSFLGPIASYSHQVQTLPIRRHIKRTKLTKAHHIGSPSGVSRINVGTEACGNDRWYATKLKVDESLCVLTISAPLRRL